MLLHALYMIVFGALESVAVLWRLRSYRDIIIIKYAKAFARGVKIPKIEAMFHHQF